MSRVFRTFMIMCMTAISLFADLVMTGCTSALADQTTPTVTIIGLNEATVKEASEFEHQTEVEAEQGVVQVEEKKEAPQPVVPLIAPPKEMQQKLGLGNLAVVKPNVPASMDEKAMDNLWMSLELQAAKKKVFNVIARSDNVFRNTINEISFQGTHLVDKRGERVRPNQIKGVKTLLCCSVGNYEGVWTLNMYLLDAESMAIKSEFSADGDFDSYQKLISKLGAYMSKLFNRFTIMDAMLVNPVFPEGVVAKGETFTKILQEGIFEKVTSRSEHELEPLLKEMGKTKREEVLADDWERFHNILAARFLVEPRFTTFAITEGETKPNPYNGQRNAYCHFKAEGYVVVTDTTNGQPVATIKMPTLQKRNAELGPVDGAPNVFKETYPSKALAEMAFAVAPSLADALTEKLNEVKNQ